jgi:hypothetical protein
MAYLVPLIKNEVTGYCPSFEVLDCVPVPLMKRCRGERHKLFGPEIANIGKGGSDQDWYYGVKLALSADPQGFVSGFIIAPAKTSERWSAEYLLCYRNDPSGRPARVEDLPRLTGKSVSGRMERFGRARVFVRVIRRYISPIEVLRVSGGSGIGKRNTKLW